jgi:hypothetical protein
MKHFALMIAAAMALASSAFADQPTAASLLAKAKTQAAQEHKNIFVMFDASW